jgi:uncharacterized membrane protein (UPF0127 family)
VNLRRLATVAAATVVVAAATVGSLTALGWLGHRTKPGPGPAGTASRVSGFDQIAFRVAGPTDGSSAAVHCALLARTTAQQEQGLMFRRDLAGYAGMLFEWSSPTTDEFYMKNTLIPLSIAWFDQSGRFVSAADMAPCPADTACPLYPAAAPYTIALEVPQGGLGQLGIGPGASLVLAGPCR